MNRTIRISGIPDGVPRDQLPLYPTSHGWLSYYPSSGEQTYYVYDDDTGVELTRKTFNVSDLRDDNDRSFSNWIDWIDANF